ncbi:1155_t:CDS:2 [Cetraspora pellucida]|uniref:1155_t:CDS:1 n=1 Tax=Cetraspora pellucida TaxID=1433469 RepID=A0ACA9N5N9_9GLOM|nr:1155_t:CDS:2 [Cetraspora pellucida]
MPLIELSEMVINVKKLKDASEAYSNFLSTEKMTMLIHSSPGTWKTIALREIIIALKDKLDEYNEKLYLAFKYSSNQHFQIVPFFHPQGQINLDAQIQRDWKKRALCFKEGIILITISYCVVDLPTFIKSALNAFGFLPIST